MKNIKFAQAMTILSILSAAFAPLAHAEYIYDTYRAHGVQDAQKLLQVQLMKGQDGQPTNQVEIRTLCRDGAEMKECADRIVVPKDRLEALAKLENVQYQRLLASFDKNGAGESVADRDSFWNLKPSQQLATGAVTAMALALACPPAAAIAGGAFVVLMGGTMVAVGKEAYDEHKKLEFKDDPRLGKGIAQSVVKALNQDVGISDSYQDDMIQLTHEDLKAMLSDEAQVQLWMSQSQAISQNSSKPSANVPATAPSQDGSPTGGAGAILN
jgi:hypothetical protein